MYAIVIKMMSRRGSRAVLLLLLIGGCAGKPVVQTHVVEKPIPVPCRIEMPSECKSAYAVDRVSPDDGALAINRALRAEIEERWACETKLRAALAGCNTPPLSPTH
jgi:hypothetical protein